MYPRLFNNTYKRGTTRLGSWHYNWEAVYFITICTDQKKHFFGKVSKGEMVLNELGKIAFNEWEKTQQIRKDMNVDLLDFVIMPNHMHAIIKIGWNQYNTQVVDIHDLNNPSGSCAMHRAATSTNPLSDAATSTNPVNESTTSTNPLSDAATSTNPVNESTTSTSPSSESTTSTNLVNESTTSTNPLSDAATSINTMSDNVEPHTIISSIDIPESIEEIEDDIFLNQINYLELDELIGLKKKSNNRFGPQSKNLASIIRGYKSAVTTRIRISGNSDFAWQSRFHEHIIKEERAFKNIQRYIRNNPKNWSKS